MQGVKLDIIKSEMDELKAIIENVFKVNLMDKRRKMVIVDSRMVFSKILRDRGYTLTTISTYLKKDHTTIMNYMDKVVYLLKQSSNLFENYMISKDLFLKNRQEIVDEIKDKDVHMKVARLNMQIDKLIAERDKVFEDNKKNIRFRYIIELLNRRVPEGKEAYIEYKIMQLLNE